MTTVSVISTASETLIDTITIGGDPTGVGGDPRLSIRKDGSEGYVLNGGANTVSAIKTSSNEVVATVDVGGIPESVVIAGSFIAQSAPIQPGKVLGNPPTALERQVALVRVQPIQFGRQLTFTYQNGLLATVTAPDASVLSYAYGSSGVTPGVNDRLASITYSTTPSTTQTYLYELSALPFALTSILDELGNRYTTWSYDSTGRALSSQYGGGAELAAVTYNSNGTRKLTGPLGNQDKPGKTGTPSLKKGPLRDSGRSSRKYDFRGTYLIRDRAYSPGSARSCLLTSDVAAMCLTTSLSLLGRRLQRREQSGDHLAPASPVQSVDHPPRPGSPQGICHSRSGP